MRKTYRFSHSVAQGGLLYAHKGKIEDKDKVREALHEVCDRLKLMDVTIKVYETALFLFFMMRPSLAQIEVISAIQKAISGLGSWEEEYMFIGVYDLQEEYVREELEKFGFEWEKG